MPKIIPISDLNDPERLSEMCAQTNEPIFITENGSCNIVVMSMKKYSALTGDIELKLDEADNAAASSDARLTGDEVFKKPKAESARK